MALDSGVEDGSERDSSSSWLILPTTSTAKVDLPEAGMPAMPTKRRPREGMLRTDDNEDGPSDKTNGLLGESVDGEEGELGGDRVHAGFGPGDNGNRHNRRVSAAISVLSTSIKCHKDTARQLITYKYTIACLAPRSTPNYESHQRSALC